jgi:hypothetical protein
MDADSLHKSSCSFAKDERPKDELPKDERPKVSASSLMTAIFAAHNLLAAAP